MAIVGTNRDSGTATASSFATNAIAFSNDKLYLVTVTNRVTSGNVTVSSITGAGLTWELVRASAAAGTAVEVWRGLVHSGASSSSPAALTVTLSGTPGRAMWSTDEFTGMDWSGTNGSGAIVQSAQTPGTAPDATSKSVTLAAFGDATNNVAFGAFTHRQQETSNVDTAPGTYTALANTSAGAASSLGTLTEYRIGEDLSVSASWTTSSLCAGVALEIKMAVPQTVTAPLLNGSGVLFTPKMNKGVAPGLISQAGTLFAPTLQVAVTSITPPQINQSGVVFAPVLRASLSVPLLDGSGQVFAPVWLVAGKRDEGSLVNLRSTIRRARLRASPRTMRGGFRLRGMDGASTLRGDHRIRGIPVPDRIALQITPGLLDGSGQLFAPSIGVRKITPPVINAPGVLFSPEARRSFAVPLLDASGQVFAFSIATLQTVTAPLLNGSGALFAPTVNPKEVDTPLIDGSGVLFGPTLNQKITAPVLDGSGVLFSPFVGAIVFPGLINGPGVLFMPSLVPVKPPLLDGSGQVFTPERITIPTPQSVRFDDDPSQFLDAPGVVFSPDVQIAPPRDVIMPVLDGSGQVFGPVVVKTVIPLTPVHYRNRPVTRRHVDQPVVIPVDDEDPKVPS